MAVPGENPWPSAGTFRGCPWGILVAACGEIAMAVDNGLTDEPRPGRLAASRMTP